MESLDITWLNWKWNQLFNTEVIGNSCSDERNRKSIWKTIQGSQIPHGNVEFPSPEIFFCVDSQLITSIWFCFFFQNTLRFVCFFRLFLCQGLILRNRHWFGHCQCCFCLFIHHFALCTLINIIFSTTICALVIMLFVSWMLNRNVIE